MGLSAASASTASDLGIYDRPLAGVAPEKTANFVERWKASSLSASLAPNAKVASLTGVNGNVLAQGTSGNQPTFLPGGFLGRPAIYFNGPYGGSAPQALLCPTVSLDRASFSVAMVMGITGNNTGMFLFGLNAGNNTTALSIGTNKLIWYNHSGSAVATPDGTRNPGAMVLTMVADSANSLLRYGFNGVEYTASLTETSSVLAGIGFGHQYLLAGNAGAPGQFVCSDMSCFGGALTSAQVQALARNLCAEYGVPLSPMTSENRLIIDGSSIVDGGHATKQSNIWHSKLAARLPIKAAPVRLCFGGASMGQLYGGSGARITAQVAPEILPTSELNLLYIGEGSNTQDAVSTASYLGAVTTAGAKAILITTPARSTAQAAIDTLNTTLMSNWETYGAVQVMTVHQDYRVGLAGALQNPGLNGTDDNIHTGDSGNAAYTEHALDAALAYLRLPGVAVSMRGSARNATTITLRKLFVANNERGTITLNGAARRVGFTTTVTTGATSATQTVGSTAGWAVGDIVYFGTANVSGTISSITNSTTLVLSASVTTTTGEAVSGYSASVSEGAFFNGYRWNYKVSSSGVVTVTTVTNTAVYDGLASAQVSCIANPSGAAGVVFQFLGEAGKDVHFVGHVNIDPAA